MQKLQFGKGAGCRPDPAYWP